MITNQRFQGTDTMRTSLLVLAACMLAIFALPEPALGGNAKVTICHIPAHDLASAHDITISENALAAHLAHGDFNGKCEDRPPAPGGCSVGEDCFATDEQCPVGDCNGPTPPLPASCDAVDLDGGGTCVDPPSQPPLFDTILVSRNDPLSSDSAACGSTSEPCVTIARGINRAAVAFRKQIFVANGVYVENVVLVSGIDVLGGYSTDFLQRDVIGTGTVVHGAGLSSPTILAHSIAVPTIFEGFIVHGPTATTLGENSVAIYILNSTSDLEVKNNVIVAGLAAAGADGSKGNAGPNGNNGQAGGNSQNGATTILGGGGGVGPGGNGGRGGTSNPPVDGTQNGSGINGSTSVGGAGGAGGFNGSYMETDPNDPPISRCVVFTGSTGGGSLIGSPGGNAGSLSNNGPAGDGGLEINGSGSSGTWISASGVSGVAGTPGAGGGGGGAGGGTEMIDCGADVTGSSGGGGGAGGGAGAGGTGGQGGGGAFAIFVFDGAPTITNNLIFLGTAGNGGTGGQSGAGGSGGQGGARGFCTIFGCFAAGHGGDGGNGGHGGGAGGGAGGPSVGIFSNFAASYGASNAIDTSTGIAGFGGAGGQSLGADGTNGEPGIVADVL